MKWFGPKHVYFLCGVGGMLLSQSLTMRLGSYGSWVYYLAGIVVGYIVAGLVCGLIRLVKIRFEYRGG